MEISGRSEKQHCLEPLQEPTWRISRRIPADRLPSSSKSLDLLTLLILLDRDVDSASETKADAAKESEPAAAPKASLIDDYYDLMGENFVPVQSGGKLAGKRRGKK